MTKLEDLLQQSHVPPAKKHPKGWEPSLEMSEGGVGTITTAPLEAEPDPAVWKELIADWGLDPSQYRIVPGSLQFRGWDAPVGNGEVKRLRYYRATIVDRTVQHLDVEELVKLAGRKAPSSPPKAAASAVDNPALVVSLNDWQVGKGPSNPTDTGSRETVARIVAAIAGTRARLRELTKLGRRPSHVVLANTGDLVEATSGHYPSQPFTTDLNLREQLRVARRLVFRFVDELVTDGYDVHVTGVGCNHGQNRNGDGKMQTTHDDNHSLTIIEGVEEACTANPDRYHGVRFSYAPDGLVLVIDVNGVNLGLTHGHQMPGGAGQLGTAAAAKWWQGQIMGSQPVAGADILMTAHRHYLEVSEATGRTIIQAPALDGGSFWFTSATGKCSPPGMLTVTMGEDLPRGWGDLCVL